MLQRLNISQAQVSRTAQGLHSKAKGVKSIQIKIRAAKSLEDVVTIAKEHGHEFSEEELEGVSGGWAPIATAFGDCPTT